MLRTFWFFVFTLQTLFVKADNVDFGTECMILLVSTANLSANGIEAYGCEHKELSKSSSLTEFVKLNFPTTSNVQ